MNIIRLAAIDIGSNAVRLLINTITETEHKPPHFKKTTLVRVPIRLGEDVFVKGKVSDRKIKRLLLAMHGFRDLMEVYEVDGAAAYATSAMREAENADIIVDKIARETGIEVEVIDGSHEAAVIARTDLHDLIRTDRNYLYVDVGGGSSEFSIFIQGRKKASQSFNLGTVRLLNNLVLQNTWEEAKKWVREHTRHLKSIKMIGSGGNINHIFKHSNRKNGKPLTFMYLSSYYQLLKSLTYEERVAQLQMKLDRADVIIPATEIYLSAMEWSGARKIYVPRIGLADGIIKMLYGK